LVVGGGEERCLRLTIEGWGFVDEKFPAVFFILPDGVSSLSYFKMMVTKVLNFDFKTTGWNFDVCYLNGGSRKYEQSSHSVGLFGAVLVPIFILNRLPI